MHFQKPTKIDVKTINKSTDTDDLIVDEPSASFVACVKTEQKTSKRIKREPKTKKRTKKSRKQEEDEGNLTFEKTKKMLLIFEFSNLFRFSDEIKEEEMEIEAFEYDNDDFENDPSFAITSDLENRQLDEDDLDDLVCDGGDEYNLDEVKDTPRKRRRKIQVPDDKSYK